jgi:hypothetical protein
MDLKDTSAGTQREKIRGGRRKSVSGIKKGLDSILRI